MKGCIQFLLVASVLVAGNTYALSAQQYYDKCGEAYKSKGAESPQQAVNRALDAGSCSGYIGGVINGVNLVGNMLGQQKVVKKNFICLPKGKQSQDLLQEVLVYIKNNQQLAQSPVQLSIYNVMSENYPCQEFKGS